MSYDIKSTVPKAVPGTDQHKLLTAAIADWRLASFQTGQDLDICENAARELEIQRDTGNIVHINRRIG